MSLGRAQLDFNCLCASYPSLSGYGFRVVGWEIALGTKTKKDGSKNRRPKWFCLLHFLECPVGKDKETPDQKEGGGEEHGEKEKRDKDAANIPQQSPLSMEETFQEPQTTPEAT